MAQGSIIAFMNKNGPVEPVRIFVGCDPNDCDLEQMMVLDYSLNKHTSLPLQIHWMRLSTDRSSPWYCNAATGEGWQTRRWATPFSGFRWAVPAVCGFEGRAIYMDTDIIALADIAELWRAPMPEPAVVLAKPEDPGFRFCVSLWDNARAKPHVNSLEALQGNPAAHARQSDYF
ncbi:MAG: glycosyl transferase [Rhizobacter sp.]|nr:glycosyl transferase [Rhizobacter sp.]